MRHILFSLAILLSPASIAMAQSPDSPIPAVAAQCFSCHGANGRPTLADVPIIAGQQPLYLANALRAYKAGQRTAGRALVMQEMVRGLTDEDIEMLAKWFGEQK